MVILGLGSNKGDRLANLQAAFDALAVIVQDIRASSVFESTALLPSGAPSAWDTPFLNMAISGKTTLSPEALILQLKSIEARLGRKTGERWSPREIDLDILAMGTLVLVTPELKIPHPELFNRDFALLPLAEVEPRWVCPLPGPLYGKTASSILKLKGFAAGRSLHDTGFKLHVA